MASDEERFFAKVNKTDTCWLWVGAKFISGYGQFRLNGKVGLAHRAAYRLLVGDFESSLVIRHACDNRNCVNPEHLSVGTIADNNRDMYERGRNVAWNSFKTECPRGHEYNRIRPDGRRRCRTCENANQNARRLSEVTDG